MRRHSFSVILAFALLTACAASSGGGSGVGPDGGDGGPAGDAGDDGGMDDAGDGGRVDTGPGGDAGPGDFCGDGRDNDADGLVDEDCRCDVGTTQPCFSGDPELAGVGECGWGAQACTSDLEFGSWDLCVGDGAPTAEVCDLVDNDCDGEIDEGCTCVPGARRACYGGAAGTEGVGDCVGGTDTCLGPDDSPDWSGCVDEVLPGTEECDGDGDEDCDGRVDEGCSCTLGESRPCYGGAGGTRDVGACGDGVQSCVAGGAGAEWGACTGETRPGAEVCTGGVDEDCDGLTDCDDPDCETACCSPLSETLPVVPAEGEILFIVDRSGSMDWPAVGTTRTRWQELLSAMDGVLPSVTDLQLGLMTFPLMTGDSESLNCMVASAPDVPLALGTGAAIQSRLVAADPRAGDTPTPTALMTVQSYMAANPTSRVRFAILATDGLPEPNCGATVPATVDAINAIRTTLGVETFVLGIVGPTSSGDSSGIPALQDALNLFADAGGRPRAGATRYYEAVDGASLTTGLESIIAAATDCRFELAAGPARPASLEIRQDGALVPASGYTLVGTSLTFSGIYCDRIQAGVVTSISVDDTCS